MTFAAWAWLWGLAAAGIPLLIHFVFRRRFVVIDWAAAAFLLQVFQQNRRRLIVEHLLLLLLRMLLVVCVVLAFAAPLLKTGLIGRLGAAEGMTLIILDDSASMERADKAVTVWSAAIRACEELLTAAGADDRTVLIRLTAPAGEGAAGPAVLADLRNMQPVGSQADPAAALARASALAAQDGSGDAQVYIVTDMQDGTWNFKPDTPAGRALTALAAAARVHFIDVGEPSEPTNMGIGAVRLAGRPPTEGRTAAIEADVINHGMSERDVEMTFTVDGREYGRRQVTVPAGDRLPVTLDIVCGTAGPHLVEASLGPDELTADNRGRLVVDVKKSIEILAVNGETSVEPMQDETDYFRKAMNPGGHFSPQEDMVLVVTEVDENSFRQQELAGYDIVILANVMHVSDEKARALARFADNGGAVIIAAGDLVDTEHYNRDLAEGGAGIMPCRLGPVVDRTATAAQFGLLDTAGVGEGMLAFLKHFREGIADRIHFFRYLAITDDDVSGRASVVIRYDDGVPAVVTRTDRGVTCFFNFTLDEGWTDFPSHPLYLPFMREVVNYCVVRKQARLTGLCGEPVSVPIPSERGTSEFRVRTPAAVLDRVRPFVADSGFVITWERTDIPGFYTVEQEGFAVTQARGLRPEEGDLRAATEKSLRGRFPGMTFTFTRLDAERTAGAGDDRSRALWRLLVIMGFAVGLAEFLTAFRFSR